MQNALTVIVPVDKPQLNHLTTFLVNVGNNINQNSYIDFKRADNTHFCRWVIFDETTDQPQLLFNANFDGAVDDYIYWLVDWLGPTLDQLWGRCRGYPQGRALNPAVFRRKFFDYIKNHTYPIPVFFRAYYNRTVQEVQAARQLRTSLGNLLDTPEGQRFAAKLAVVPVVAEQKRRTGNGFLGGLIGFIFLPVQGIASLLSGGSKIKFDPLDPGPVLDIPLAKTERDILQNELTIIAPIKPSRVLLMRIILRIAALTVKPPFIKDGKLSDMTTIHFARWAIIEGIDGKGKRLLFESNYDGSWEKYIDDFIDHAWAGLDLLFGNCEGYAKGGSRNSEYFKETIIEHQWRAQVFYSAYPDISVRNIINDLAIYDQLRQFMGMNAIADWLRRL